MKTKIKQLFNRNGKNEKPNLMLKPGAPAPPFSLNDENGSTRKLSDYKGQPVVLVFYPRDDSPVCSNQLALYNDALHLFEQHEAQLLGISVDDAATHRSFADSLNLKFPLLADDDPPGDVSSAYGVLNKDDSRSERTLFVIDPEGTIRWSHMVPRNVNPGAQGILETLESMENEADTSESQ